MTLCSSMNKMIYLGLQNCDVFNFHLIFPKDLLDSVYFPNFNLILNWISSC